MLNFNNVAKVAIALVMTMSLSGCFLTSRYHAHACGGRDRWLVLLFQ